MKTTSILLACLAVGCATDSLDLETTAQAINPGGDEYCPTFGCGNNTGMPAGLPLVDAHETGLYFSHGWRLVSFHKRDPITNAWRRYRADVQKAELLARDYYDNTIIKLKGVQLLGARFTFQHETLDRVVYVFVDAVDAMQMWSRTPDGEVPYTFTYKLTWSFDPNKAPAFASPPICGEDPEGPLDFFAVLFDDDRIDVDAIQVMGQGRDWFTIGCQGSALAKQHLLGHTRAGAAILGRSVPTVDQRTANLKMILADYCGTGHPFTVSGMPLQWKDFNGFYDTLSAGFTLEARWTQNGAACVNTPRVDAAIEQGEEYDEFPHGVAALFDPQHGWCTSVPPPCSGDSTDFAGAHVLTAFGGIY